MARLHEHQGKAVLAAAGIEIPRGEVATTADEAARIAEDLGGSCVIKIQAWMTGRAAIGGVALVDSPDEARREAERMLQIKVGNFPIESLLVEEKIAIERELFVSLSIDDAARAPMLLLSLDGGTGIEDRARDVARLRCDVHDGIDDAGLRTLIAGAGIKDEIADRLAGTIHAAFNAMKSNEARSLEINPLIITTDQRIVAADCRMTIDDYAVFRHADLCIDIARELDHPPSTLERLAYDVEEADHRGTFYFAELPHSGGVSEKLIGFHGAGGGGSMMSMDAATSAGFTLANFCDTSGNPSAAKVYAAARIILSQAGIVGYFGSGSGVASQEQFWSAYGLAKAFIEVGLPIPAVIRLGGNSEDRAVEILEDACKDLTANVEGFKKDDTPAVCAARIDELVMHSGAKPIGAIERQVPTFVGSSGALRVEIERGTLWIDLESCDEDATALIVQHGSGLFEDVDGKPSLAVNEKEISGKDSELIMLEIECRRAGRPVVFVDIPIAELDEFNTESHGVARSGKEG